MRRCCCRAMATLGPDNPGASYHREVAAVVAAIGADPDATAYSLRHSSIVRQLLAHVPIRIVAATHDTSVRMIERTYSKHITEHADDISRKALLQLPAADPRVIGTTVKTVSLAD